MSIAIGVLFILEAAGSIEVEHRHPVAGVDRGVGGGDGREALMRQADRG